MLPKIEDIKTPSEFADVVLRLLEHRKFKIEHFFEGTGSDGGRDIEAYTFETDCSGFEEPTKWWIELKYRGLGGHQSSLGAHDLTDLSSKLCRASARKVKKFLLITNTLLTNTLIDPLKETAEQSKIDLRIWNKTNLSNHIKQFNESMKGRSDGGLKSTRVALSDRIKEVNLLTSIIGSELKNVVLIKGSGGVGKSSLARYIMHYLSQDRYAYGLVDCRMNHDFGFQLKLLANHFQSQGISTYFSISSNLRLTEQERMMHLIDHCVKQKTVLILDNFEEIIDMEGNVGIPLIQELIIAFLSQNMNGSSIIITSRTDILDRKVTSQEKFYSIELAGWDLNYVYNEYLPYLQYLQTNLNDICNDEAKHKEILGVFKGNPFALKIANQLCIHYDIRNLITDLDEKNDVAQKLIDALSGKLTEAQIKALNIFSQFNRPLSNKEIEKYVCENDLLQSLIIRGLIEPLSTERDQYHIHPLTAQQFSHEDNYEKRVETIGELILKICEDVYGDKEGIDTIYNHGLLRQVVYMLLGINRFEDAAGIIIKIGTRAVSMGDIEYLKNILTILEKSNKVTEESLSRLLKVKGHIYDYEDNLFEAKQVYQKMLDEGIRIKDDWSRSAALNGLGTMERHMGNLEKAISLYTESLAIRISCNDLIGQANSYHNLGAVYLELSQLTKAEECLEKARTLRKKLKDIFRLSATELYLGECYIHLGKYNEARKKIDSCIKTKQSFKDAIGLLWARLARVKVDLVDIEGAYFEKVKEHIDGCINDSVLLKQIKDSMMSYIFCGCCTFLYEKNIEEALLYFRKAQELSKGLEHPEHKTIVNKLMETVISGKRYEDIKQIMQQSALQLKI